MNKSRNTILVILAASLILVSCRNKNERNNLVPEKELVDVLTELYIGNSLLMSPPVRDMFKTKDSILNHIDILNKHGISKEKMDKTLRYYFEQQPKKLENIYDQVLTKLNEKEALVLKEIEEKNINATNLWKLSKSYSLPDTAVKTPVWFSVPVKDTGNYKLEFSATMYRDDKSLNPRVSVFFWHTDSSKAENKTSWDDIAFTRDGGDHQYSVSKQLSDTVNKYIGGWLLVSDPQKGQWQHHVKIEKIILRKVSSK